MSDTVGLKMISAEIAADTEMAWAYFCNMAMPIKDAYSPTFASSTVMGWVTDAMQHQLANEAAAHLMQHLFGYDITNHPLYQYGKSGAQAYAEIRVSFDEAEDAEIAARSENPPMSQIDVRAPLELSDGREAEFFSLKDDVLSARVPEYGVADFTMEGEHIFEELPNLRNRQEPQSTDPKLVERAAEFIHRLIEEEALYGEHKPEARSLLDELRPRAKTDEEWAEQLCVSHGWLSGDAIRMLARECMQKGRELERGGK